MLGLDIGAVYASFLGFIVRLGHEAPAAIFEMRIMSSSGTSISDLQSRTQAALYAVERKLVHD